MTLSQYISLLYNRDHLHLQPEKQATSDDIDCYAVICNYHVTTCYLPDAWTTIELHRQPQKQLSSIKLYNNFAVTCTISALQWRKYSSVHLTQINDIEYNRKITPTKAWVSRRHASRAGIDCCKLRWWLLACSQHMFVARQEHQRSQLERQIPSSLHCRNRWEACMVGCTSPWKPIKVDIHNEYTAWHWATSTKCMKSYICSFTFTFRYCLTNLPCLRSTSNHTNNDVIIVPSYKNWVLCMTTVWKPHHNRPCEIQECLR